MAGDAVGGGRGMISERKPVPAGRWASAPALPQPPMNGVGCMGMGAAGGFHAFAGEVMGWRHMPLRVRCGLVVAGVTALEASGFSVLFLRLVSRKRAIMARETMHSAVDDVFFRMLRGPLPEVLRARDGHAVQVVDADRRVLAATKDLRGKPPMASFTPRPGQVHTQRTLPHDPTGLGRRMTAWGVRMVPEVARRQRGRSPLMIYTAAPRVPWYASRQLAIAAGGVSALVSALAFLMTWRSMARTLTPVEAIRREFAEITATDLSRRVPVPEARELRDLAQTLNAALGRLEAVVTDLRYLASEASHDLRGPLTGIRVLLEEALTRGDDVDWPEVAAGVLAAVDRQQAIVTDLLTLSRLDTGQPVLMQRTDLSSLVSTEVQAQSNDRVPITCEADEQVMVDCNPLLIQRLLGNLLDNAQRHAASRVTVTLTSQKVQDGVAVLTVEDDGDGIPPDQHEKIFERFTRLASSRDRDPYGTGLGLPISRHIAEVHHGSLTIEDRPGQGACFALRLPLSSRRAGDEASTPQ
ncbi:sensor histidine kinase [Actinomadura rubrobrunea]|nr:HAMP domain-containing sensor histidine kinase [Actinomadura rubrobrunea]